MKSVKPVVLLSFLFFASVIATDVSETSDNSEFTNDLADFDDIDNSQNYADADEDYQGDDNEDIIYRGMVSAKPPPVVNTSPSLIKAPVCKKWRCNMNGYIPIWKPNVTPFCSKDYLKLSIQNKAFCQTNYCVQVCSAF